QLTRVGGSVGHLMKGLAKPGPDPPPPMGVRQRGAELVTVVAPLVVGGGAWLVSWLIGSLPASSDCFWSLACLTCGVAVSRPADRCAVILPTPTEGTASSTLAQMALELHCVPSWIVVGGSVVRA